MKKFTNKKYQRTYERLIKNPPPKHGSRWYRAFWNGYDNQRCIYPATSIGRVLWMAGREYKRQIQRRS